MLFSATKGNEGKPLLCIDSMWLCYLRDEAHFSRLQPLKACYCSCLLWPADATTSIKDMKLNNNIQNATFNVDRAAQQIDGSRCETTAAFIYILREEHSPAEQPTFFSRAVLAAFIYNRGWEWTIENSCRVQEWKRSSFVNDMYFIWLIFMSAIDNIRPWPRFSFLFVARPFASFRFDVEMCG